MATITGGTFTNIEDLGQAVIDQLPGLQGRDREEIGEMALSNPKYAAIFHLKPESYGDIDVSTAAKRFIPDVGETAGESVEGFGQMAWSPWDTGKEMVKMAGAGLQNLERKIPGTEGRQRSPVPSLLNTIAQMDFSPETTQAASDFAGEMVHSVSPAGIQERPALALSNALIPVPGGAGANVAQKLGKAGKFSRALNIARKARNIIDPAELPFTAFRAGGRGVKKGADLALGLTGRAAGKTFESAKSFARSLQQSDGTGLGPQLAASIVGLSTGSGARFVREMFRTGTDEPVFTRPGMEPGSGVKIQREFRAMDQGDAEKTIVTRGLESVDRIKKEMGEEYAKALERIDTSQRIDVDLDMRREAQAALDDLKVKTKNAEVDETITVFEPEGDLPEGSQFPASGPRPFQQRTGTRVPTRQATFEFPDFGDEFDQTTAVASQGTGRALIEEAFGRLINAPDIVSVGDMMMYRRAIDDALKAAGADVSGEARVALGGLRQIMADKLSEVPGYTDAMAKYEQSSADLFTYAGELGLSPGHLNEAGEIRDLVVSDTAKKMINTLTGKVETPLSTLRDLEKKGGDTTIIPALVGAGSAELFGSGLVGRSEISQIIRGALAVAVGGGSISGFSTIPAVIAFSPAGANELFLRLVESGAPGEGVRAYTRGAEKISKAQQGWIDMVDALQKANRSTGGELAKAMAREGITLGQLSERLQISTGVEGEGGDFAPRPRVDLSTIGGIGTSPPSA